MSTRTKFILTFVGGVLAGIVLSIVAFFVFILVYIKPADCLNQCKESTTEMTATKHLFGEPKQEISAKAFRVADVLKTGDALARVSDSEDSQSLGTEVLILAQKDAAYYDDQIIEVPAGKVAKQIGTYEYSCSGGDAPIYEPGKKTVPIVDFCDK